MLVLIVTSPIVAQAGLIDSTRSRGSRAGEDLFSELADVSHCPFGKGKLAAASRNSPVAEA